MIVFVPSGLKSLREESPAAISVCGSSSVAAAKAALGTALGVKMQELLLGPGFPAACLVNCLQNNGIYLSTTLSSS